MSDSAAQQIQNLTNSLNVAYTQKADAEASVKDAEQKILAIRNVLAGVQLGQKLAAEMATQEPPPST